MSTETPKKDIDAEVNIYDRDGITITNLRAVFAAKTYAVSNITSVEAKTIQPSGCVPAALIVLGLLWLFVAFTSFVNQWRSDNNWGGLVVSILMIVGGFLLIRSAKPSYAVSLTTSAGEVKAYTSSDWETIRQIVEALNSAIIKKG